MFFKPVKHQGTYKAWQNILKYEKAIIYLINIREPLPPQVTLFFHN